MNEIELLAHKISTIILMLKNIKTLNSCTQDMRTTKNGGSLYLSIKADIAEKYIDIENEYRPNDIVDIASILESQPVSSSPLTENVSTGFEGFLWYNTSDASFVYQHEKTNYDTDIIQFINPNDEAEVFQKSLVHNAHQMLYLMLFSTMHKNQLIKGLKFYIKLELVPVAYDLLMQGYSYEV